jgi:RNA polymerase sigma-70 factor (ECF subfamily)
MSKPTRQDRFLVLLDEHKKILFKAANSYCRNPADRQDLVQEMVLQLWRSFDRYDDRHRFSTWMYRVALNVAISSYRSEARRARTIVPADDSILEIAAKMPESAALEGDLRLLQGFIEQLGELDRALIILYLDGNRYDAIAEVLGISETNVGTKISRIKQRLRREWADLLRKEQATWSSMT